MSENEITAGDYRAIEDAVYDLHFKVHRLMDKTAGPSDPAWQELHEMMNALSVVSGAACRYAKRAELPREPVDYRPAEWLAALRADGLLP